MPLVLFSSILAHTQIKVGVERDYYYVNRVIEVFPDVACTNLRFIYLEPWSVGHSKPVHSPVRFVLFQLVHFYTTYFGVLSVLLFPVFVLSATSVQIESFKVQAM